MSLSGSLSALSLPELLQVVALSRKTGRLEICSDLGVAWLGLSDGGIVRVALEDGALDRDEVLKRSGLDPAESSELVDATLWDAAVQALLSIFEWTEGEFTFEPTADPSGLWRGPPGVVLPTPLSPEFLALEGARLEDEGGAGPRVAPPESFAPARPTIAPTLAVPSPEPEPEPEPVRTVPVAVICVDPDLGILERIKRQLSGGVERVHIFQDGGSALTRLKQYVLRGEFPALIIGVGVPDPLDARRGEGWRRFVERVRDLAPQVPLTVIGEGSVRTPDGVQWVERPRPTTATEDDISAFLTTLAHSLGIEA